MLELCRKRFWQFRKISSKTLIIQEKFGRRPEKHIPPANRLCSFALIRRLHSPGPSRRQTSDHIGRRAADETYEDGVNEWIAVEVPDDYGKEGSQQAGDKDGLRALLPVETKDERHEDAAGDDTHAH